MRKIFFTGFLSLALMTTAMAQSDADRCNDPSVHSTLIELNNTDETRGFSLKMFETFTMPSGNLIPFTIQMEQGKLYSINYVVNPSFKQYTFTIIDKDNQKPVNKKFKSSKTKAHYLNQNFVAPYTGQYIIVVSQKGADKGEHCGGLSLMQAAGNK